MNEMVVENEGRSFFGGLGNLLKIFFTKRFWKGVLGTAAILFILSFGISIPHSGIPEFLKSLPQSMIFVSGASMLLFWCAYEIWKVTQNAGAFLVFGWMPILGFFLLFNSLILANPSVIGMIKGDGSRLNDYSVYLIQWVNGLVSRVVSPLDIVAITVAVLAGLLISRKRPG